MRDYFYSVFPGQLARLSYAQPSQSTDRIYQLAGVSFFGGRDWKGVTTDLAAVPASDLPRFVLALFMVVLTDQALYTYQRDAYETWRRHTAFPKFGWTGFGTHNESPFKILSIPEKEGLVDPNELIAAMPGFVEFLVAETRRIIVEYSLPVNPEAHFDNILRDQAYGFGEGVVVPAFKAVFEKKLGSSPDSQLPGVSR